MPVVSFTSPVVSAAGVSGSVTGAVSEAAAVEFVVGSSVAFGSGRETEKRFKFNYK